YGITNNLTVGVGVIPLFLFDGTSSPIWITPKFSIPVVKDKFNVGVGGLLGTVLGEEETGFGILYGAFTVGDRNRNLNVGVGYGYFDGTLADRPVINISGMLRLSPKFYLISENYIIQDVGLISLGGRVNFRKVSLDFGLYTVTEIFESGSFAAVPLISVGIPFGNPAE
ncbi:MAG: hypothetical protein HKN16_06640, partial [Saprospiraceae bacterium]|nr:hypothetical protein [Saprospiraceae bacterium]